MDIQIDSRLVRKGDVFVGITCNALKAHLAEAIANGARIVFAEGCDVDDPAIITVSDARLTASILAKIRYPRQPECCVAVTGTQGKSSVVHFLRQIWAKSERKAASLGTVGLFTDATECINPPDLQLPNLTTPDPVTIHRVLEYLDSTGVTHLAFEASSHGIQQKRLHSVTLAAAAFTNFASDHLDYHKTREAYLKAKLALFREILPDDGVIVSSCDDPTLYDELASIGKKMVTFGLAPENTVRAENVRVFPRHITCDILLGERRFSDVSVNLVGKLQISNILCAAALAYACGMEPEDIAEALPSVTTLEGRMEYITTKNGGDIYVDYAHTTDSFKCALSDFRSICKGRLICVFGCGGDRDETKRQQIGALASERADVVIITDDNPRSEDPARIRQCIMSACPGAIEIGDRKEAIQYAVRSIEPGDVVVILGKGHEHYQICGAATHRFSDREVVLSC
ncbi:MAG: UDP-N-acetylmuramoyl-L-alanyl-D-glutamate--2,6-diaminopimelate ligase [Holosporales bacterium]|jgi:UDP-N-acetylmuramoyl-L-alanyl-D-glutamate--2,6-diaminopimelate ligase|nr:UDP-N-acetylmuramoyl-L-alanyl-D-glutamate--2,6-diaminopimelate ligase [Holosporales bacterium]